MKIPVFYNANQTVASLDSYSPSARKPDLVVKDWIKNFEDHIEICDFAPVTREMLYRSHDMDYVDGVLDLKIENGFRIIDDAVSKSLPFTSGSLLGAAMRALDTGIAASPTSGFHHACYGNGGGFCTFNGIMVTAMELFRSERVKKVGIIDCDCHYGNGTDNIINKLDLGLRQKVKHYSAGAYYSYSLQVDEFMQQLPKIIHEFSDCDIIIYQAGADPHVNDPLGGWLTDEQLHYRDQIVFAWCEHFKIPCVWNLAGGYQTPIQKVLDIHNNTMRACIEIYGTKI